MAVVLLGMLVGCGSEPQPATQGARGAGAPIAVAAIEISARDLYRTLVVTGTVEPRHRVRLASRIAGLVHTVRVEEGQQLAASEVLAELDMAELRAELTRARAEEEAARLSFQRATELHARGVQSTSQLDAARVALEVAESEHALRRTRVDFGTIVSPLDAVVSARMVEPGEAVQAHATLFELVTLHELVMRVGVSELDVVHLRVGDVVPVLVDALPAVALEGVVSKIFPTADTASRLTSVEIALPSESASLGLRPGFMARLSARIDVRANVLAVPVAAVGRDASGHYVYVIDDGTLQRREITLGAGYAEWTEIKAGLQAGEVVLASNPIGMRNGQSVRVVATRSVVDER